MPIVQPVLPELTKTRSEVDSILGKRLDESSELVANAAAASGSASDADEWRKAFERWRDKTADTLRACYSNEEPAEQFMSAARRPMIGISGLGPVPFSFLHNSRVQHLQEGANVLRSLAGRLELLSDPATPATTGGVSESEPPRFVDEAAHDWAIRNLRFLEAVFDEFDRDANWPLLQPLQRQLVRAGEETPIIQAAYDMPQQLGYREAQPAERVVLSLVALRYVENANGLLADFVRLLRLASDRYRSPTEEVKISRSDLTDRLGMSESQATKISRVLRFSRFLTSVTTPEAWEEPVYEPGLVPFLNANSIDDFLRILCRPEPTTAVMAVSASAALMQLDDSISESRSVFVVHGRDDGLRESVARVLERLEFAPVILLEKPNQGRTLIEKFETNTLDVGFAVVILALFVPGTETPSDIHGLAYVPLDEGGAWKYRLAAELEAAGYEVDTNKLR